MRYGSAGARVGVLVVSLSTSGAFTASASPILTTAAETQIEAWLGAGDLDFRNIFTKGSPSDTTLDWHQAVDGRGATVSLLSVTDSAGAAYVIGGYNPQSWDSLGAYHMTVADADRTAFIFNLTTNVLLAQKAANYDDANCSQGAGAPNCGKYQTYNYALYGPTFGAGHDLNVGFDLNSNSETGYLNVGYEEAYSYGPSLVYYDGRGLLPQNSSRCGATCGFDAFTINGLETYTFAPATPVPEPSTLMLLAAGLASVILSGRRVRHPVCAVDHITFSAEI